MLVILQPLPFRSGGQGDTQGEDVQGCGSGDEEASKEQQRHPLSQMLHWVLRTQR